MNIEGFRKYCLSKKGVTEEFPFDNNTLVFKVMGKMFALTDIESFEGINLKCEPELAAQLREEYAAVQPGFHMNRTHWNTVVMDGTISDKLLRLWIDGSYDLVAASLPKKDQQILKGL